MKQVEFVVPGMDCATEEAAIRRRLAGLPGIERTDIDLVQRRLTVAHTLSDESSIVRELKALGMPPNGGEDLNAEQRLDIAAYLKSLAPK